ncbi:MAG TPA: DUF4258 domain-containing protein [Candidatus Nitrosotalea sp.]|nr:DUF4258 domain-containing protein [Candidatus Nitrosotalea sp.]
MSNQERRIRMSQHASQRASERDITEDQVRAIINKPVETVYDADSDNYKSYGLAIHPFTKNDAYLMVVHSKFNTEVLIITVMWTTTGGLRTNGFKI